MSIRIHKSFLNLDQLSLIKICCTYFEDPLAKEKEGYRKLLDKIEDPALANVKKFATMAFFGKMDDLMIKYLGRKISQRNLQMGDAREPLKFYIYDKRTEEFVLPYTFGRLLVNKNMNNNPNGYTLRPYKFTGTLRDHQIEPVKIFTEQLNTFNTTTVGMYPGAGKTIMAAFLGSQYGLLTCILVNRVIQIKQWENTFNEYTDATVWTVGTNGGTGTGASAQPGNFQVIICMDERFNKIPPEVRKDVGMLIIDEAHLFCVRSKLACWLSFQPKYLVLETATLKRPEDAMERVAYAAAGMWGHFVKSSKEFLVHPVVTTIKPHRSSNVRGQTDFNALLNYVLMNETRDNIILKICQLRKDNKILILTTRTEHVERVQGVLNGSNISCSTLYGNKKTYDDANILIGTTSKIGTAFDEASFSSGFNGKRLEVMILCCTIKKFTTLEQNIGRVMRSVSPEVYVLIDNDPIFKSHWYLMKWWLQEFTRCQIKPLISGDTI